MSPRIRIAPAVAIVFCAGLGVLLPTGAAAQQPNVDFSVSGTSTVRSWTCTVKGVLKVTPGTGAPSLPGMASGVQAATLTVPVKDFKCPNDEMTQHLMETMKPEQHAEITYRLERYVVNGGQAEATGSITINGVTAPLTLPLTVEASGGRLQVAGNTRIDMTKFRVDPPVVMLGLLKVGPQIRIEFKGVVAP
jgi:polyisoprenoid-binding protein YceI